MVDEAALLVSVTAENMGFVDPSGMNALSRACHEGLTKQAVAHLEAGVDIDSDIDRSCNDNPGFTPLMYAALGNRVRVVRMLIKLGADGTKTTNRASHGHEAGSTAFDLARKLAGRDPEYAKTFAALRKRCCNTCGMTSPRDPPKRTCLKKCTACTAAGSPNAHYCSDACQLVDWPRHRGECAEARQA